MMCPNLACKSDRLQVLWVKQISGSTLNHFQGTCERCHEMYWKHEELNSSKPWRAAGIGACSCPRNDDLFPG
jgi:hypothetical protein